MKFIPVILMIVFASFVVPQSASADSMRELFRTALKDGKSEGVLDDNIAYMFKNATGSNDPVAVHITQIESYESPSCGRLHVEMSQSGIKGNDGKTYTGNPGFDISICADGRPPKEIASLNASRVIEKMKSCIVSLEKGKTDKDGIIHGAIVGKGCPAEGKAYLRYAGDCDALKMKETESGFFPIDNSGSLSIELKVPAQCKSKKNVWEGTIVDSSIGPVGGIHLEM